MHNHTICPEPYEPEVWIDLTIALPEIGRDITGNPRSCVVLPISPGMRRQLHAYAFQFVDAAGEPRMEPVAGVNGRWLIAAMCARDETGGFAFGATFEEALWFLETIPAAIADRITRRISDAARRLTHAPISRFVEV